MTQRKTFTLRISLNDNFVELNRTFHPLPLTRAARDDADLSRWQGVRGQLRWSDLLAFQRVVLLSEAGAGKTEEIRHIASSLRANGKQAYFLRIEHACLHFESAFEVGSLEAFEAWRQSDSEGWVFLDSVDEARIKDPKNFELAIKRLGRELKAVLQQVHVVITGRNAAWRAKSDLALCHANLPFKSASREAAASEHGAESVVASGIDIENDEADGSGSIATREKAVDPNEFQIVALDPLHDGQVDTFVRARGVVDVAAFRRAVEAKDAEALTTRPLDLDELVDFWNTHRRIGTRRELVEASIARRLVEHHPDHAIATSLTPDRLRQGARLLAAATTLSKKSDIRLPGADASVHGLEAREVLSDWTESDIATLLARPIFGESLIGAVRFHVQRAREFLTAEWLEGLLVDHQSRTRVEGLLFRTQYGREVVVPAMRGALPWLALLDDQIRERTRRVAPEVLFEGGDPSHLPTPIRGSLLREACRQLAGPNASRISPDYQAVQNFSGPDLADDVKALLAEYRGDDDVIFFLMRVVWHGEIRDASPEALDVALNSRARYARLIAIRALATIGTESDRATVRAKLLTGPEGFDREWLAEAMETLPPNAEGIAWLLRSLARVNPKQRFSVDELSNNLEALARELPLALLPQLVEGLHNLLKTPPFTSAETHRISKRHGWLLGAVILAMDRLVMARSPWLLNASALSLLKQIAAASKFGDSDEHEQDALLGEHVAAWRELNYALFWHDVETSRQRRLEKTGERLTEYWHVGAYGSYWRFKAEDFDAIAGELSTRALLDDRLVALSLACTLYWQCGRPRRLREQLQRQVKGTSELQAALYEAMHPKVDQRRKWKRQEEQQKRRRAREAEKREENRLGWVEYLRKNVDALRQPGTSKGILNAQYYLHRRMHEGDRSSTRWTDGRWRVLIPEFGESVANAFRDGAVATWHGHRPTLQSEGAPSGQTTSVTIFGLTGLLIESRESPGWASRLTSAEAEQATRYAMWELNGFPPWLSAVFDSQPEAVVRVLLGEIDFELQSADAGSPNHYLIADVEAFGAFLWDRLAPDMVARLKKHRIHAVHLRQLLSILAGSSVSNEVIGALAAKCAGKSKKDESDALWFAAWMGVDPKRAVPALKAHLVGISDAKRRTELAMNFVTALIGGRREKSVARDAYCCVQILEKLYSLMHRHVAVSDDRNRAGGGVYSPDLRDDAQDSRERLFALLKEIPGKETYLALQRIATKHPSKHARAWIAGLARQRAAADADLVAWAPSDVRAFTDRIERVPATHRDLWDLAVERLLDLKHELEDGETSNAAILLEAKETQMRTFIADWCRTRARRCYVVPQEEEFADKKSPDIRFQSTLFDGPVPVELKLADRWSGPDLIERLENQLCDDYMRDRRSSRGIYLVVHQGRKTSWQLPGGGCVGSVDELVTALQFHADKVSSRSPRVDEVRVIGIDLTKRAKSRGRRAKRG